MHNGAATNHPTVRTYINVFVALTVLTVIEVVVAALPLDQTVTIAILVILAILKAALVVLYYMHLRYDSPWYWAMLIIPIVFVVLLTRYLIIR